MKLIVIDYGSFFQPAFTALFGHVYVT